MFFPVHCEHAKLHLVANLHPGAGLIGFPTSPLMIVGLEYRFDKFGTGIAESKAFVYGCFGFLNSSADGAFSSYCPRYITAISSEICFTTLKS